MPIVEYFDQGTQQRKRKEFGYGAMGKEKARKFLALQKGNAAFGGYTAPKMVQNKFQGERYSDTMKKEGPAIGAKPKPSPKQKLDQQQDYDQKELDKNKPSEAKTKKKKVKYVKLDEEDDRYHKRAVGGGGSYSHGDIPGS